MNKKKLKETEHSWDFKYMPIVCLFTCLCFLDFGLSKESENDQKTYSFCGTVEYMAPEVSLKLFILNGW